MLFAVSFSTPSEKNGQVFNNADSFAMAFDLAWKQSESEHANKGFDTEQRLCEVLKKLNDHPFMMDEPLLAKQIGAFRVRLLNLSN